MNNRVQNSIQFVCILSSFPLGYGYTSIARPVHLEIVVVILVRTRNESESFLLETDRQTDRLTARRAHRSTVDTESDNLEIETGSFEERKVRLDPEVLLYHDSWLE